MVLKRPLRTKDDLSMIYTPGVAEVSKLLAKNPRLKKDYTIAGQTIAIVTDGTAVLGLGDIGPEGALPVMEGKAALFKRFANLDAFPICLATKDVDEIVRAVQVIAPVFTGVNLEDISAPRCFEIENRLQDLGIPVMHDDQHGTAVVVLAGLINACRILKKNLPHLRIIISGAGAAGTAVARLLKVRGAKEVIVADSKGVISRQREDLNSAKQDLLKITNSRNLVGQLSDALRGADVFIGVSAAGIVSRAMVESMNNQPIIFALANPTPEILPKEAKAAGAAIIATGRSDFDNQINNALAFPGIFLGAIKAGAPRITEQMKVAAAEALASYVKKPTPRKIVPSIFDKGVAQKVAKAVTGAYLMKK